MNPRPLTGFIATALAVLVPAAAQAAPSSEVESLNGDTPGQMATDANGVAWVTIDAVNDTVARVKPGGAVKKFAVPELDGAGDGALGPDGDMWFTVPGGVTEFDPADPVGTATEHAVASITDPRGITRGPAGRLYAASGDQLVSFRPDDVANFKDEKVQLMAARDIVAAGGEIFVADFGGGRIIRATKNLEVVKRYGVEGGPQEMAAGPSGKVAYGNPGTDPQTVGRINPTGKAKTTEVPNTDPFGMSFMPDGRYWFAEFARHRVGTLSTTGEVRHKNGLLPANSGPRHVAEGKNGVLYVGLETAKKIAIIKGIN